ncbi:toxoplasma gondii family a protein [Cystoisospora suis]|uniref:Toxoplasma gondii family a protein n=1 Tax=Cystoisospora suis TaxID=483139 RepID=A0A2C6JZI9_9APIC|nr:toxoplasma gondii family a protein [Cystoisospora suis]
MARGDSSLLRCCFRAAVPLFIIGRLGVPTPVQADNTTSGLSNANVVLSIPAGGSTSDRVEEVSLGGSQILLVIDESNKAVFMPQAQSSAEPKDAENLNEFVYAFENGACNFNKTLTYEEMYPGLGSSNPKTFWVKTTGPLDSGSSRANSGSASVTKYVFTNPSSEKLDGKKATFCVRFQSPASLGTSTTTTTTPTSQSPQTASATTPTSTSDTPSSKVPENGDHTEEGSHTEGGTAESQVQREEKASGASLQALKMKELANSLRMAQAKQEKENFEGSVNFLEKDDTMPARRLSGARLSEGSGDSKGETPAGHYLTVIIHSSASHIALHTLSIFAVLTSSLSAILRSDLF